MTLLLALIVLFSGAVEAHHYKGLPHYSYFENYPQVPYLEFIEETADFDIYVTIYNFQGLKLDMVDSPDDVRFYIVIHDVKANRLFKKSARFKIYSGTELLHDTGVIPSEQENIFVIQQAISQYGDLRIEVEFPGRTDVSLIVPFQIKETLFQRFGLIISILIFFLTVAAIKLLAQKKIAFKQEASV